MRESDLASMREQLNWLEDVIAGLMINGVSRLDIEIRYFQNDPLRVVVAVRGVPKYEHKIKIKIA